MQWKQTTKLYEDLRRSGVFINAPDFYYLNGTNKCGMGYRETNWSLPARTNRYIRGKIFLMGHGLKLQHGLDVCSFDGVSRGGAAATIEPLSEHIDHYQRMMISNLALGVQAHYRGPRLFDSSEVREMVQESVTWFKKYRDILESDLIHGRRADGRRLDWMLHVNPELEVKGMLCVFNPTDHELTETITVDLYYTGIDGNSIVQKWTKRNRILKLGAITKLT
ncbi:MAG: hypothetical protein R3C03_00660 [Pirellulaceae bacterium]